LAILGQGNLSDPFGVGVLGGVRFPGALPPAIHGLPLQGKLEADFVGSGEGKLHTPRGHGGSDTCPNPGCEGGDPPRRSESASQEANQGAPAGTPAIKPIPTSCTRWNDFAALPFSAVSMLASQESLSLSLPMILQCVRLLPQRNLERGTVTVSSNPRAMSLRWRSATL